MRNTHSFISNVIIKRHNAVVTALIALFSLSFVGAVQAHDQARWAREFPKLNLEKVIIPLSEIEYDGNTRDSIPPIYTPVYEPVEQSSLPNLEPVIAFEHKGDARAYPLSIMLWHEIVNDVIGGRPVAITYCPLCNSGVVYDRRLADEEIILGNTGRIRHLDMVMFDHQTESFFQQFSGKAIVGDRVGQTLTFLPSRLESFQSFKSRFPNGQVLVPNEKGARPYGNSPFAGFKHRDFSARFAHLPIPNSIDPAELVVVVGDKAWPLKRLKEAGVLKEDGVVFEFQTGRASIHDGRVIATSEDEGQVIVTQDGKDITHDTVFAFAFASFVPNGTWYLDTGPKSGR